MNGIYGGSSGRISKFDFFNSFKRLCIMSDLKSDYTKILDCFTHPNELRELLDSKINVDSYDASAYTALHKASSLGIIEIVTILLDYGASVNIQTNSGWTALHSAVQHGHDQIVKLLLDRGASPNLLTSYGFSVLHYSAEGSINITRMLLEHKADVNIQDVDGHSILHLAAYSRRTELVRLLLDYNADVSLLTKYGTRALQLAGNKEIADLITAYIIKKQNRIIIQQFILHIQNKYSKICDLRAACKVFEWT